MQAKAAKRVSRATAIALLRSRFLSMCDDDTSMCRVAAQRGIFCKGFSKYTETELRRKYWWLAARDPEMGREELEDLANKWQLAREMRNELDLACDVQRLEHDTCNGWNDFSNEQLSGYCSEILGQPIVIES